MDCYPCLGKGMRAMVVPHRSSRLRRRSPNVATGTQSLDNRRPIGLFGRSSQTRPSAQRPQEVIGRGNTPGRDKSSSVYCRFTATRARSRRTGGNGPGGRSRIDWENDAERRREKRGPRLGSSRSTAELFAARRLDWRWPDRGGTVTRGSRSDGELHRARFGGRSVLVLSRAGHRPQSRRRDHCGRSTS
jgi:hypothetical protein